MESDHKVFLHADMDAFFASVEQHNHPELKGKPVVVGSPPDRRGVVAAVSYEARKFGIHSAMPSRTAFMKCPEAIFLPVNMVCYKAVSGQIMRIFESYTPLVQPLSIDEAFLDVTGAQHLFGNGEAIAHKIRADILRITGLTASIGVAPNMFLAKIASDLNKPNGLTIVPSEPEAIRKFLAPLPVNRLWGIGRVTGTALQHQGITTIGQLQQCDFAQLQKIVGQNAATHFLQLANGIDHREIVCDAPAKSISNEHTFDEDLTDRIKIETIYRQLIDTVGFRLRQSDHHATNIHLKLRWSDFSTITRQAPLVTPSNDDTTLLEAGMKLLDHNLGHRAVRLIGFGVSELTDLNATAPTQQVLFELPETAEHDRRDRLSRVADKIRGKYGKNSIRRASNLET